MSDNAELSTAFVKYVIPFDAWQLRLLAVEMGEWQLEAMYEHENLLGCWSDQLPGKRLLILS